jgi:hypothetical protein
VLHKYCEALSQAVRVRFCNTWNDISSFQGRIDFLASWQSPGRMHKAMWLGLSKDSSQKRVFSRSVWIRESECSGKSGFGFSSEGSRMFRCSGVSPPLPRSPERSDKLCCRWKGTSLAASLRRSGLLSRVDTRSESEELIFHAEESTQDPSAEMQLRVRSLVELWRHNPTIGRCSSDISVSNNWELRWRRSMLILQRFEEQILPIPVNVWFVGKQKGCDITGLSPMIRGLI